MKFITFLFHDLHIILSLLRCIEPSIFKLIRSCNASITIFVTPGCVVPPYPGLLIFNPFRVPIQKYFYELTLSN